MKRAKVTYGQLDGVLRSLGFSCRIDKDKPPARIYEHEETGALIMLPALPKRDRVYEHHMVAVRIALGNFGVADPSVLDAKLQKAG